jgi:hypothetical protein
MIENQRIINHIESTTHNTANSAKAPKRKGSIEHQHGTPKTMHLPQQQT